MNLVLFETFDKDNVVDRIDYIVNNFDEYIAPNVPESLMDDVNENMSVRTFRGMWESDMMRPFMKAIIIEEFRGICHG